MLNITQITGLLFMAMVMSGGGAILLMYRKSETAAIPKLMPLIMWLISGSAAFAWPLVMEGPPVWFSITMLAGSGAVIVCAVVSIVAALWRPAGTTLRSSSPSVIEPSRRSWLGRPAQPDGGSARLIELTRHPAA